MTTALVPDPATQPTMTVEDVAKALGISRGGAYNAIKTGDIPAIKIGISRVVVPTAAIRRLLQLDGPNAT